MGDDRPADSHALLARAAVGEQAAWGELLSAHEDRLARMVAFRMDPRLRGRADAADVVQEDSRIQQDIPIRPARVIEGCPKVRTAARMLAIERSVRSYVQR